MFQVACKGFAAIVVFLSATGLVFADYKEIPMNQKRLATYYIQAHLEGSGSAEFMVDTGAGYTTINEDTLERLISTDSAHYVGELTGVLADGSIRYYPIYRIRSLVLGGDCVLNNVEAAVFPDNTRMLLGLTALEKAAPFVFSTNPPQLSLSNCNSLPG